MKKLEICCYSAESAILAAESGAHRIELCDNYKEGGTTPSYATIQKTIENIDIPVNVLIRPRGSDFLYSEIEFEIIKRDVEIASQLGVNGIVVGFLLSNGDIDINRTQEIVELAKPLEVTFHRAFDMCNDPFKALKQLKNLGVSRILTSGTKNTAEEGIETIARLVELAGNDLIIMPGSGINENNLKRISTKTKALEFHSSAKTFITSKMEFYNESISMGKTGQNDEFNIISVSRDSISKMVVALN